MFRSAEYQGPRLYERAIGHEVDLELTWRNTRLQTYAETDGRRIQYLINQRHCMSLSVRENTFQRLLEAQYPQDFYPEIEHLRPIWTTQFSALPDYNPDPENYQGIKIHLRLEEDDEDYTLHWRNTKLRLFLDKQFDHIEYYNDQGILGAFQTESKIMEDLQEFLYPSSYDPEVDTATYEWLVGWLTRDIEQLQSIDFRD